MIICPNCSFNNINSAKYCQECGTKFHENASKTIKRDTEVKFTKVKFNNDFLSLKEPRFLGNSINQKMKNISLHGMIMILFQK